MKFGGWQHENEFRVMVPSKPDEQVSLPIGDALTHLLVGEGNSEEQDQTIRETVAGFPDLRVRRVRWRNGLPVCVNF